MKYNNYSLERLSIKAQEKLPEILDSNGYKDRYKIGAFGISINSTLDKVKKFFHLAEKEAQGEEGYLVHIKRETTSSLWVPEAKSLKEAYKIALEAVENGWPVEDNPVTKVGCAEDSPEHDAYREEWQLEYMPDKEAV